MRLELEILDGTNKGKRLMLQHGLKLGKDQVVFVFDDAEMSSLHAVVSYDQKKSWSIECLAPNKLRLGFEEVARASLIVDLIFHLGQTGFRVVEHKSKNIGSWQEGLKTWLEGNPAKQTSTEIFFFLRPIRLSFIQGSQYEEIYTLSYGPRELGYNSLDLNIKDPNAPTRVAKFFQIGDQSYIKNLCAAAATLNGAPFDEHVIFAGDVLRVASCAIELSVLS